MKRILVMIFFIFFLAGCRYPLNDNEVNVDSSNETEICVFDDGPLEPEHTEANNLYIVSDYMPDNLEKANQLGSSHEALEMYMRYADYTETGIQLVSASKEFGDGHLVFTINDAYSVDNINERGISEDGFSRDTKMYWTEQHGWQEADKPIWLNDDGSFDDGILLILVDITVYNDGAVLNEQTDQFGKAIDHYTFSADSLVWLSNMKPNHQGFDYGYTSINYFSLLGENPDYAYQYQVPDGCSVNFTVGFVVGPGNYFDSNQDFFLCNTCGNPNGIYIGMMLENKYDEN